MAPDEKKQCLSYHRREAGTLEKQSSECDSEHGATARRLFRTDAASGLATYSSLVPISMHTAITSRIVVVSETQGGAYVAATQAWMSTRRDR